jgi:hypothetical protein
MRLIINKINYRLNTERVALYYSFEEDLGIKRNIKILLEKFDGERSSLKCLKLKAELEANRERFEDIYFSFTKDPENQLTNIEIDLNEDKYFRESFVVHSLKNHFKGKYIIGKSIGKDLYIYKPYGTSEIEGWVKYKVISLLVSRRTISVALASRATYISRVKVSESGIPRDKITRVLSGTEVKHVKSLVNINDAQIVANLPVKKIIGLPVYTGKLSYKGYYQEIKSFYENELLLIGKEITIYEGGFEDVISSDIKHVDKGRSVMLFKGGAKNVNASNGMKYNGPYQTISEDRLNDLSLIFIYKDSEDANSLYKCLKNGLRHFPGLESYVGIPVKPNKELSLRYSSFDNLVAEFDAHLKTKFKENNYSKLFAFYISPFKKDEAEGERSDTYYRIKEGLLKKGIASQVIASRNIHSNNFHFSLPNIAVAILAKLGGVPWKLARNEYEELIIGFGRRILPDGSFVGNTVFFDNSGLIKQVSSLAPQVQGAIGTVVKESIIEYLQRLSSKPKRVVIHYYKPPNKNEVETVEKALSDLGLDIPYVIIEIHDTKARDFICFDADYQMGMPKSGTIIRLSERNKNYLLFNNSRYEERPAGFVNDEYPIKVRIHHAQGVHLDENTQIQLIDQVYEFSRMYWRSLRQQSHPVTVKYAKLIADFASKFENHVIPENEAAQETAWFI